MVSLVFVLIISAFIGITHGSAIPVWELLKKEEKVSYLYSTFAKQVEHLCTSISTSNCIQETLKYGIGMLKNLSEDELDNLDPYQRGADNLIWDTLMAGHEFEKTTPEPRSTSTAKPNSYDDESISDNFEFGSQESASAKIDNVYRVAPSKSFVFKAGSGSPQYNYPHNVVSYVDKATTRFYNQHFPQQYTTPYIANVPYYYQGAALFGPIVVRVYPDGTPVREPQRIPQDDDLRQYQLIKIKLPNF